jgi:hypothetical protein
MPTRGSVQSVLKEIDPKPDSNLAELTSAFTVIVLQYIIIAAMVVRSTLPGRALFNSLWWSNREMIDDMTSGVCDHPFGENLSIHSRPLNDADEGQLRQEGNVQRSCLLRMKNAPYMATVPMHCNQKDSRDALSVRDDCPVVAKEKEVEGEQVLPLESHSRVSCLTPARPS